MEKTKAAENLSQWFRMDEQKPWEPGVYEVSSSSAWNHLTYFSYWCGEKFHGGWGFPKEALENKDHPGDGCGAEWRGLASDPNAKPKARGNRKVTRYVVMREGAHWNRPIAVFDDFKSAEKYKNSQNKKHNELLYLETVRFRTHEAS